MLYTMDVSVSQSDFPNLDAQPNRRRRKKSMVWEHFTVETVNADCIRACCKQCKKSFAYISGSKLAGTSHLKRHIALGICPVGRHNQGKDLQRLCAPASTTNGSSGNGTKLPRKRYQVANGVANVYFNQDNCGYELAKMIIQHDYPLHMVEHNGFIDFARILQPQFSITSVTAVQEQVMNLYIREKKRILDLINGISGYLSLTLDLWTSDRSLDYVLLTGHFIDHDWKLQRCILNAVTLQYPDPDAAFSHAVSTCLADWKFEDRLFTLTLDHCFANGNIRESIRNLLAIKNPQILNGQLINCCYARILRTLAQDALWSMRKTVVKVRDSVKYVKISQAHEERFIKLKQQLQVPSSKTLIVDDLTQWNTTYQMLLTASELKEVFSCLDTSDPDYQSSLSMEDWYQVETVCSYLKLFYEAASILTSPVCPTANLFFHGAWNIHLELRQAATSPDFFVSSLIRPLDEKFSKYWEDCSMVLAVAAVMDPRFKLDLVKFCFSRMYDDKDAESWTKIVEEGLRGLYFEYVVHSLPAPTFVEGIDPLVRTEVAQEDGLLSNVDGFTDLDILISDIEGGEHMELDQYLQESIHPRVHDFDVLGWWQVNRMKYPTLSKLAADVLAIPVSSVPPERVFDTRQPKMDSYRSSLKPATLEALICSKYWLQQEYSNIPSGIPVTNVKTEI